MTRRATRARPRAPWAPFVAIAEGAFVEVTRQPAFTIVLLGTLAAYAITPALSLFSLGEEARVLRDFGLSTMLVSGLILTSIAAGSVMRREVEDQTVSALLAKPVRRETFLVGKFAGVASAVSLAIVVFAIALMLSARASSGAGHDHGHDPHDHLDWPVVAGAIGGLVLVAGMAALRSYRHGRSFCGGIVVFATPIASAVLGVAAVIGPDGRLGEFATGLDGFLVPASVLVLFSMWVLAAFAVSVAVWVGRGATFLATSTLLLAGLAIGAAERTPAGALVVPDFSLFWAGELAYVPDVALGVDYLGHAALQALAFTVAYLALGALALRRRAL